MTAAKRSSPKRLGTKARRLWVDITRTYALRADELRVLEDACREVDLIERMEEELARDDAELVVRGSMGQDVAAPLLQELRQHRSVVARLLGSLKLPDENSAPGESRAPTARTAAAARWGRGA